MSEIVGILLAAGQSRRFGSDKRLYTPSGEQQPMLFSCFQALSSVVETWVILHPGDEALAETLSEQGARTLICAEADQGMGHSLAAGVKATSEAKGWLVALADMPWIAPETCQTVVNAIENGSSIARPAVDGKAGHPVGFAAKWFAELSALSGDAGARYLIREHQSEVTFCPVSDDSIHRDIDTLQDLASY